MSALGAGCRVPAGFYGEVKDGKLTVSGVVGNPGGGPLIVCRVEGEATAPQALGKELAERLKAEGAMAVLEEVRG